MFTCIVAYGALLVSTPLVSGTRLDYAGTFEPERDPTVATQKSFELFLLIDDVSNDGATVYWTLVEKGTGGWKWPDHFGRFEVDSKWQPAGEDVPAILYERLEGDYVVPISFPAATVPAAIDTKTKWQEGRNTLQVVGETAVAKQAAWQVSVEDPLGRFRDFSVEKNGPIVLKSRQRVFIGRGEQHHLSYQLTKRTVLNEAERNATIAGFELLFDFRKQLGYEPRNQDFVWTTEQAAQLKKQLPALTKAKLPAPLDRIVASAELDTKTQKERSSAIGAFESRIVGQRLNDFQLLTVEGQAFDTSLLKDKITVIHFWTYLDEPLREPYGQVGYLDFLYRRHNSKDVMVVGIAVNEDFANPEKRGSAVARTRKLRSFMNLTYPILRDNGSFLERVGDPRLTGAKLPLYVVLDRTGKVEQYHVGFYEVDRDRGLKALDETIERLSAAKRP